MRMIPMFSSVGLLLGHLDMDECLTDRHNSVVVEKRFRSFREVPEYIESPTEDDMTMTFCRLPIYRLAFCKGRDPETRDHLSLDYIVADEGLPVWFWDAFGTVEFNHEDWSWRPHS